MTDTHNAETARIIFHPLLACNSGSEILNDKKKTVNTQEREATQLKASVPSLIHQSYEEKHENFGNSTSCHKNFMV
jgi:hypothetical protein